MMEGKHFSEEIRKKLAAAAKKGRRIGITAVVGAVALGSISYTNAAGIEDVFDEHYYADMYPDLKAAYGYDRAALLEHFMKYGIAEGRAMNEMIDIVKYREAYKDLDEVFGDDWDAYVIHYLTHGAFEHRDSGTDFDPVDYLNRYGELKDAFGEDILAAYRHYEEHGKQEGREARSEAVVKAEEAQQQAGTNGGTGGGSEPDNSWGGSDTPSETPDRPTETPNAPSETPDAPTETPDRPTETPDAPSETPDVPSETPDVPSEDHPTEPGQEAFAIQKVEVRSSGHIRVTLNRATEQPLAQEAFSIICNSGGSDMTIISVSTEDNAVYDLTTAYYRDQDYDIQITLADGTAISKVFSYRTDCAQITDINAVRTGGSEAVISYITDRPGAFYYILRAQGQIQARAVSLVEVVETVEGAEPTEAEVIRDGSRAEMNQHENTFTVTGLTDGVSYTMYYVAVDTEEKATLVNSLTIDSAVYEETAAAIKGAKPFKEKLTDSEYLYGFEIELAGATSEALTLEQFDISCPKNKTSLGQVKTSDNKTYRVYMPRGTVPYGNTNYTILINLKDGTQLKGTCYFDVEAPNVSMRSIEWTDEDTIKVTVNSDEGGTLYYRIQDVVEGEGTTAPKDPAQIYAAGTKVQMGYGLNYITIKGIKAGQWFCWAPEDARGNRAGFYSYKKIPEYTAPDEGDMSQPKIMSVEVIRSSNGAKLKVVFNQEMYGVYKNSETQISGLDKKLTFMAEYSSEGDLLDNVLTLTVMDSSISIPAGSHTLTIVLYDGTTLTYDFTV